MGLLSCTSFNLPKVFGKRTERFVFRRQFVRSVMQVRPEVAYLFLTPSECESSVDHANHCVIDFIELWSVSVGKIQLLARQTLSNIARKLLDQVGGVLNSRIVE